MAHIRRVKKELQEIQRETSEGTLNISAGLVKDNLMHWTATIFGPEKTAFEGGVFKLEITFGNDYPFRAPKFKFLTPIFHPNINSKGDICLDILKQQWSPAFTVTKVLLCISSLLADPNPDDPLNTDAATLYKTNRKLYEETVKEYVAKYANN